MTDKQKIVMLTSALIYNTVALNALIYFLKRHNKHLVEEYNELWEVFGVALETCDTDDERLQQWATNVEFDLMTRTELKSLKKKWWQKK